jgi:hypothetical protein
MVQLITWLALACDTCSDLDDPRRQAYFDMTMVLSIVPLIAMGLVVAWLYRRSLAMESPEAARDRARQGT